MAIKDHSGLPLEKGFYLNLNSGSIAYFTGEYAYNGHALCEDSFGVHPFTESVTNDFKKIKCPRFYLETLASNQKFLSYKILDLEKITSEQSIPK